MKFGQKIRYLRENQRMSVKELAERADCTSSFISQIERGLANPSINTLKKISDALNISLVEIFDEETADNKTARKYVVKNNEQIRYNNEMENTDIYLLTPAHIENKNVEMYLMKVQPGGRSDNLYVNKSEEIGYVIKGTMTIFLDDEELVLNEGDSICFPGEIPHRWENRSGTESISVWAVSPPIFKS